MIIGKVLLSINLCFVYDFVISCRKGKMLRSILTEVFGSLDLPLPVHDKKFCVLFLVRKKECQLDTDTEHQGFDMANIQC